MKNHINTVFTIADLKANATENAIRKYEEYVDALRVIEKQSPVIIRNGRVNHYWFQEIISILSDGELKAGGQGNSEPDMYWGDRTIEFKGFTTSEFDNRYPIRVAASKYFASNGGITKLKNSDKTLETMKEIVFSDSYSDDYYILSETCGLKSISDLEDVRLVFLEAPILKKFLIEDCGPHAKSYDFKWESPDGKSRTKKINWPYLCVDTTKMIEEINSEVLNEQQC